MFRLFPTFVLNTLWPKVINKQILVVYAGGDMYQSSTHAWTIDSSWMTISWIHPNGKHGQTKPKVILVWKRSSSWVSWYSSYNSFELKSKSLFTVLFFSYFQFLWCVTETARSRTHTRANSCQQRSLRNQKIQGKNMSKSISKFQEQPVWGLEHSIGKWIVAIPRDLKSSQTETGPRTLP